MTITLHPGSVPLKTLETIYRTGEAARLDASFDAGIKKAAARIAEQLAEFSALPLRSERDGHVQARALR